MAMKQTSRFALAALACASLLLGCYVEPGPGPGPAPPPPPPPQQTEVVEAPPPPPPPESEPAPPPPPGPDYGWVAGYQRWNGHGYAWERGHYEHRPHAGARWNGAHWEERGRAHVWVEGRWE
jgi:hypothetical protein